MSTMEDIQVITSLVAVQVLEVGLNTLIKAESGKGMSHYVFIVYSNAMSLSLLLSYSFFYYRKRPCSPISTSIICKIFLLGCLSCGSQIFLYIGIGYSSPVLASVMADLSPAFTFFLAIIFRYEKLELKELSSHAKCVGTVLSIIGALTVTLYSGEANSGSVVPHNKWLFGGILLALHTLCVSLLLNVKTWIVKEYNEVVITVTIASFFLVMMSTIIALFAERNNPRAWILRPDMELAAILYSGLVVVTTRSMANIYACRRKGPVFVAMFTPFGMVIALVMGLLFLGESFSLASVIGGGIISIGFYGVLWGQARQEKMALERKVIYNHLSSSSPKGEPLLHNQSV